MAKRGSSPDVILARLAALRQAPSSPEFAAELKRALAHTSPALVARGAELATRYNRAELADDLCDAFHRFHRGDGGAEDKQCMAVTAVARALVDLVVTTAAAEAVYLAGVATFRGRPPMATDDFGAELRATSAVGLVNARHPDALRRCADLLADPAPIARVGAVRAVGASGDLAAPLLLRLRLRLRDPVPEVLAECATELMKLDPGPNLDLVAGLLRDGDPWVRAAAALAIGSSRQPGALDVLRRAYPGEREPDVGKAILVAAAGTRSAEAADWLVSLIGKDARTAVAAIEALAPYRLDEAVKRRAGEAIAGHGPAVAAAYGRVFG